MLNTIIIFSKIQSLLIPEAAVGKRINNGFAHYRSGVIYLTGTVQFLLNF